MASLIAAGGLTPTGVAHAARHLRPTEACSSPPSAWWGVGALLWFIRRVPLPSEGLYPLRTLAAALVLFGAATVAHGSGFLAVFVSRYRPGRRTRPPGRRRSSGSTAPWPVWARSWVWRARSHRRPGGAGPHRRRGSRPSLRPRPGRGHPAGAGRLVPDCPPACEPSELPSSLRPLDPFPCCLGGYLLTASLTDVTTPVRDRDRRGRVLGGGARQPEWGRWPGGCTYRCTETIPNRGPQG